ncbi:hypothetical protein SAMN05421504_101759 [Amycolatopsis xylanica]|uniref:Uncharacterized protein n=1 Tax=Amycolatopsis xylanica TaxID=589385 RepID=A0A1H2U3E4_9PSEU|nr:hypothetical protein [Amycolatopsis xylanica]SDW50109.1 hypothetical protein SAMN05421504_101759 [Amycolatopsis xylanica]
MALALASARGLRATGRNPSPFDAELIAYYDDLLAQSGMTVDTRLLAEGRNIDHAELAESVVDGLGEPDLILLAYAVPDLHPMTTVAARVNHLLGGRAQSMAISEQGLQAPYTALRIADAYHQAGQCDRAVLLVLEQTTLPYHDPMVHDTPLTDTAAAIVLEPGARGFGKPWSGTSERLAAMIDEREGTLVVAGPWVKTDRSADVHRCADGTYCTSVWLALAENHDRWHGRYESILLADVDPRTGKAHAVEVAG